MGKKIFLIISAVTQIIIGIIGFVSLIWIVLNRMPGTISVAAAVLTLVSLALAARNIDNYFKLKNKENKNI